MSYSELGAWSVVVSERQKPLAWQLLEWALPAIGFLMGLWSIWSELGVRVSLTFTAAVIGVVTLTHRRQRAARSSPALDPDGQWRICQRQVVYRPPNQAHDLPHRIERVVRHVGGIVVWLKRVDPSSGISRSVRVYAWRSTMSADSYRRLSVLLRWHSEART